MPSAKECVYYASTALVVFMYAFAGLAKITPIIAPSLHEELRHEFVDYATKTPVQLLKLDPDVYRVLVGTIELTCVAAILFAKRKFAVFATWLLALVMVGAMLTHILISDPADKIVGSIVGLLFLLTRLYTTQPHKAKTG